MVEFRNYDVLLLYICTQVVTFFLLTQVNRKSTLIIFVIDRDRANSEGFINGKKSLWQFEKKASFRKVAVLLLIHS